MALGPDGLEVVGLDVGPVVAQREVGEALGEGDEGVVAVLGGGELGLEGVDHVALVGLVGDDGG